MVVRAVEGIRRILLGDYQFANVLDVGSGDGAHAQIFRHAGKPVTELEPQSGRPGVQRVAFLDYLPPVGPFDCVWMSHVLEHQRNPGLFLEHIHRVLAPAGVLAITVPPLKHSIVGGHVTLWNAGLLLYNLVLAGFDCREARVKAYGYDITVLLRRKPVTLPALVSDYGDIDRLAEFLPPGMTERFDGNIQLLNWGDA